MSVTFLFALWIRLVTPAEPLHELTHMVVAVPFAEDVSLERTPDGRAFAQLQWGPEAPVLWVRLAHLAPTLVGTISALVTATVYPDVAVGMVEAAARSAAVALGVPDAAGLIQFGVTFVLAVNWVMYALPSGEDLRPFEE